MGKRPVVGGYRAGGGRASTRPSSTAKGAAPAAPKAPKPANVLRTRATKLAVPQEPPEPREFRHTKGAFGTRPAWMTPKPEPKPEKPKLPPPAPPADPVAPGPTEDRDAWLEEGRLLFARPCTFFFAAQRIEQLPEPRGPEVAFCGRSNVGKSSLINALAGQNALARVSNTPGRTKQLNFFDLSDGRLTLVDMPGYGYAEAAKSVKEDWQGLMFDFLRGRPTLKRLILLIDARIETKAVDFAVMDLLSQAAVAYQIVLTKADDVTAAKLEKKQREIAGIVKLRAAALPSIITTSSQTGLGIPELRAELASLAE